MVERQQSVYLTLGEAREMIGRGVAVAKRLRQAGTIVVTDAGGNAVSISRMDDAPIGSLPVSRAKAYLAAIQGRPTAVFANNAKERPEIYSAFQHILRRQPFPGPGGMPIFKNGRVVGGIATGGGIGPYNEIPGVDRSEHTVDGVLANAEDLVICTALGIPYASQHGERPLRSPREEMPVGELPLGLEEALHYADRAIAEAAKEGLRIGVAVVDELGRLIQNDRMDGSPLISCELAEAKAMTACKMQRPSGAVAEEFKAPSGRLQAIEKTAGFTLLGVGGGVPIVKGGRMVGAIGVSGSGAMRAGSEPVRDEDIAKAAIA